MKKILLLPCFFISLTSQAQTKLTIQSPSEICSNVLSAVPKGQSADNGFCAARQFENHTFGTTRSFLQFDLSSIPQGSFVNWAKLSLFSTGDRNTGSNSSVLRRITSSWNRATINWDNQPTTSKQGQVHLQMSTSETENYKNINVTNLVQQMVDSPTTSFGFSIKLDTETADKTIVMLFYSPAFNKPQYNPKLVIEYTAPGMHPTVTSMSVDLSGASTEMNIYPNPCNKAFNCNIKPASTNNMNLRVIDMLGRTVYSQPVNTSSLQMRVNLPSSSAGTYFVILQDNNGTIVSQQLQVN